MNDLPTQTTQRSNPSFFGSPSKEIEQGGFPSTEKVLVGEGRGEVDLPKEVIGVGVKVHPTTVPIPQSLTSLGVQSVGSNTNPSQVAVILPLTDEQIVQGLHQSMTSSWRWLAVWCRRRLQQLHVGFKIIHGKLMRIAL